MNFHIEQRVVLKFLVTEGVSHYLILSRLENVFGDECLSRSQVFEWSKHFNEGRRSLDGEEHPDRPLTVTDSATVERVQQLIRKYQQVTLEYTSDSVEISMEAVHKVLHGYLGMGKVCDRWMPKMLISEQNPFCRDAFLKCLVTQGRILIPFERARVQAGQHGIEAAVFCSSFKVQVGGVFQG